MLESDVFRVFLYALLTAVATGLGALPFVFVQQMSRRWLGISNAIAAGLMGAASWGLIYEGLNYSMPRTVLGILLGLAFIVGSRALLGEEGEVEWGEMQGAEALKVVLILGVMTLHSFTEGVGVGVSFGGGDALGIYISLAIAVHNIPEGLAISLVMVPRGTSVWKAAGWSVFSSLPQPLMAVPAFLFVDAFQPLLPVGLGFAAGAMIWMIFSELVPDALEDATSNTVAIAVVLSVAAMIAFQQLVGEAG
jgi:zinc transporter ZupT